jgi:hemolysin III
MAAAIDKSRPILRGHFHQAAFFYSLGATTLLIAQAHSGVAFISSIIYGICLAGLFGISSLYHRVTWGPRTYDFFRRLDHAMIFVFIAGTGTPICLVGLPHAVGIRLLWLFWGCAVSGVIKELFWIKGPKWVSAVFYVAMGWLAAPYLSEFFSSLGSVNTWLMITGGIVYTIGALIYAIKKPNPFPRVFGYHEVFHVLVMIASVFHFIVIYRLIAT